MVSRLKINYAKSHFGCEVVLADAVACEVLVVGKIMDKRQTH